VLAYVRDGGVHWQQTFPGTWVSTTVPVSSVHTYTFTLTAYDQAGNTGKAERVLLVAPFRIFVPIVYVPYKPLVNGDFEQGLANWSFGGELTVSVVSGLYKNAQPITGTAAMLGCVDNDDTNSEHGCWYNNQGGVPIGRAMLWRSILVPSLGNPRLTIDYRIFTHDLVYSTNLSKYYDTFEIYVNAVPPAAGDLNQANRDALCRYGGTWDTTTDGLAFCDGKPSDPTKTQPPSDLGWRRVTLDLSNYLGQTIDLYLANYNRQDNWFNTWTYVDNVTVVP
jgi:hypothetical protein